MSSTRELSIAVTIAVTVPEGFGRAELAPLDLTQTPQLAVEQWEGARDASGHLLAWGCVGADVSAWNADATELAQDKLAELASKSVQTPMHTVRATQNGHDHRRASAGADDRALASDDGHASARTFLAFTADHAPNDVHACFVACDAAACAPAVESAKVTGALGPPPSPGVALGALSWAVHEPHSALAAFGGLLALAAALAIATRPGKRKKTKASHS